MLEYVSKEWPTPVVSLVVRAAVPCLAMPLDRVPHCACECCLRITKRDERLQCILQSCPTKSSNGFRFDSTLKTTHTFRFDPPERPAAHCVHVPHAGQCTFEAREQAFAWWWPTPPHSARRACAASRQRAPHATRLPSMFSVHFFTARRLVPVSSADLEAERRLGYLESSPDAAPEALPVDGCLRGPTYLAILTGEMAGVGLD